MRGGLPGQSPQNAGPRFYRSGHAALISALLAPLSGELTHDATVSRTAASLAGEIGGAKLTRSLEDLRRENFQAGSVAGDVEAVRRKQQDAKQLAQKVLHCLQTPPCLLQKEEHIFSELDAERLLDLSKTGVHPHVPIRSRGFRSTPFVFFHHFACFSLTFFC